MCIVVIMRENKEEEKNIQKWNSSYTKNWCTMHMLSVVEGYFELYYYIIVDTSKQEQLKTVSYDI